MIDRVHDSLSAVDDGNVRSMDEIIPPIEVLEALPNTDENILLIQNTRKEIRDIINGFSPKKLIVVGPCSIHDPKAALEYAHHIKEWQKKYQNLLLVMRVYFEKPRTTVGWK